jgi:putative DNA primase/helicase
VTAPSSQSNTAPPIDAGIVYLKPRFEYLPDDLPSGTRYVVWKGEKRNGQTTKVPYNARTGRLASSTDASTWSTREEAIAAYNKGGYNGLGIVLCDDDDLAGIDLDKVVDPNTGAIDPDALAVVQQFASYAELSPSGTGIRILVRGILPPSGRKRGTVEVYETERFLTLTGHHLTGTPTTIELRQAELDAFHARVFGDRQHADAGPTLPPVPIALDDQALLDKAMTAKNGQTFWRLYRGDTSAHNDDDSSADLALGNYLAFWYGRDPARMDRVFRASGLYRDKWDRQYSNGETYGERTIALACRDCREVYSPAQTWDFTEAPVSAPPNGNGYHPPDDPQPDTASASPDKPHLTDIGNAQRFVLAHGSKLRYCYRFGCWYIWTGRRWEEDERGLVERLGKQTVLGWYALAANIGDDAKRKAVVDHARKSEAAGKIEAMLRLARSEDGIPVLPDEFDRDPWLLNCLNGTLDLRTGELHRHDPAQLLTKIVPISYDPAATCPTWEAFLEQVLPDPAVRLFLQRACGYAATGNTTEQALFFPFGAGANGKSTFLNIIMAALGDYAKQAAPDLLTYSRNERHPTELADLVGVRFVASIEVDEGKRLAEALVKQMTGGDRMKARRMRENFFDFTPTHKVFLAANHRPVIRGTDHAIWRRIHLVPFGVTIPTDLQDKRLPAKLTAELPGILRWIVDGCIAWQRDGLRVPEAVAQATRDYRDEQDVLGAFIAERCIESPTAQVTAHALYVTYSEWCKASGEQPLSQRGLGPRLQERGYLPTRTKAARGWVGIALAALEETGEPGDALGRDDA